MKPIVVDWKEVQAEPVDMPGACGALVRLVAGPKHGVANLALRVFTLEPGGNTPNHTHDYEHGVFVIEGEGELHVQGEKFKLEPGIVAYVPPNLEHQFKAKSKLSFLCVVPKKAYEVEG